MQCKLKQKFVFRAKQKQLQIVWASYCQQLFLLLKKKLAAYMLASIFGNTVVTKIDTLTSINGINY